jgi:hypothetical protein
LWIITFPEENVNIESNIYNISTMAYVTVYVWGIRLSISIQYLVNVDASEAEKDLLAFGKSWTFGKWQLKTRTLDLDTECERMTCI